jgi:hypothetical protein
MAMATVAGPVHASLTGTDVVVPSSASSSGAYGSQWVTTLWLTNRTSSPVTARLSFLQRDVSNTSPVTREELLGAGESRRYDDVVGTFFGLRDVAGAIRIRATGEVLAVSRTFNDVGGVMKDSLGTSLDALPAGMAIGVGRTTTLLGATPDGSGALRYNFGFVEVDGEPATVRLALRGGSGSPLGTAVVSLRPLEMKQSSLESLFPDVETSNAALDVTVSGGDGRIIAFATLIPTGSNSPTGFVMSLDTESFVGPPGPAGPQGPAGAVGPQGPVGPAGAPGTGGPAGPAGPQGERGLTGAVGLQGPAGVAGATGPQGPAGLAGPQGERGPTGAVGAQGPAGPMGPVGATGAAGPQGPVGPAGPAGTLSGIALGRLNDTALLSAGYVLAGPAGIDSSWVPTSRSGAPSAREEMSVVWTGSRMIVWGGTAWVGASGAVTNTGGVYDPVLDTWTPTSTGAHVGSARRGHTAVWGGGRMTVFGGLPVTSAYTPAVDQVAVYDPATDTWSDTSLPAGSSPGPRFLHSAVWANYCVLVWGGLTASGGGGAYLNSGGCYNPLTNTWQGMPTLNAPEPRIGHTAVWTGTQMLVWGGVNSSNTYLASGGNYDSSLGWAPLEVAGAPSPRIFHTAVWTGTRMLVWGGLTESPFAVFADGGTYDPFSGTWAPIPAAPIAARALHTSVWTGTRMVVWGGTPDYATGLNTGAIWDPGTGTWTLTPVPAGVPEGRIEHVAVWTGQRMVVWGGANSDFSADLNTGGLFDPSGGPLYYYRRP